MQRVVIMTLTPDDLQARADRFGIRLATYLRDLPTDAVSETIVRQLARSGSAIGANYHATRRSRSRPEFIARLAVVIEEADETVHWLEHAAATRVASGEDFAWLLDEAKQLLAIYARSLKTAKRNYAQSKTAKPRRRER